MHLENALIRGNEVAQLTIIIMLILMHNDRKFSATAAATGRNELQIPVSHQPSSGSSVGCSLQQAGQLLAHVGMNIALPFYA